MQEEGGEEANRASCKVVKLRNENEKSYINEVDVKNKVLKNRKKQMTPGLESVGGRKNSDTISHR